MSDSRRTQPWTSVPSQRSVKVLKQAHQPLSDETSTCSQSTVSNRENKMATLEKHMDEEVEEVLKDWDSNVKCRKQETICVKSKPGGEKTRRKRSSLPVGPENSPALDVKHVAFPEIAVFKREDESFDTSSESIEEDGRGPHYTTCPTTGQKLFKTEFEAAGYDQKNISVKVEGNRLIVHAIQKENIDGRKTTNQLCRKIKLPNDIDKNKLRCALVNDKIIVEAPTTSSHATDHEVHKVTKAKLPTFLITPKSEPRNVPIVKDRAGGQEMNIFVDVGRVFHADDIVVKVKGQDKILITANREEENLTNRLCASLSREFELDQRVVPLSLKAGLTVDGVLKISADISTEPAPQVPERTELNGRPVVKIKHAPEKRETKTAPANVGKVNGIFEFKI